MQKQSTVYRPTEQDPDPHPHACLGGVVYMTYTAHDEAIGEETERIEAVPCRRCTLNATPSTDRI